MVVVNFPIKPGPRTCGDCDNAYLGSQGVYCSVFKEVIWDERVAVECEEFEGHGVEAEIVQIKDRR